MCGGLLRSLSNERTNERTNVLSFPYFSSLLALLLEKVIPLMVDDGRPYGLTIGLNPPVGQPASNYTNWTNLFADMANLGCSWLRFQLSWSNIQFNQSDPVSAWSLAPLDDAVFQCNSAGIHLVFPLRNAPSWAFATSSQRMTDQTPGNSSNNDGVYAPDPTLFSQFAQAIATRYNGLTLNTLTGQPYGFIDAYEVGNEEFNSTATSMTNTITLAQTLTSGQNYATFQVSALPFQVNAGTTWIFGVLNSGGQLFQVSTLAASGATQISVQAVGGGTFTASATVSTGSVMTQKVFGFHNSPYALYNAVSGMSLSQKAQPTRDPYYFAPVLQATYPAIKASSPNALVGMCAMWWTQPTNIGGVPNTPLSNYNAFLSGMYLAGCKGYFDYVNFHWYTNAVSPQVGSNQVITLLAALSDIASVLTANGEPAKPIWLTEFGWQSYEYTTVSQTISPGNNITVTPASTLGMTANVSALIDTGAAQETVTIKSATATTFKANFANAHTGTWPVVVQLDTDPTTMVSDYLYALDTGRQYGLSKIFFFTLSYTTQQNLLPASSLVQWNFESGGSQYVPLPAYQTWQNYTATYPRWLPPMPSLLAITDSIARGLLDFQSTFSPGSAVYNALQGILVNVSGQAATMTLGRLGQVADPVLRQLLLQAGEAVALNLLAYFAQITSLMTFASSYYPLFDTLDSVCAGLVSSLASYALTMSGDGSIINALFLTAFNAYALAAISDALRKTPALPALFPPRMGFPTQTVDPLYSWVCGSASTLLFSMAYANAFQYGGGQAPLSLYKTNAGNALGGAVFTITYLLADGVTQGQVTFKTDGSVAGSSTLSSGSHLLGVCAAQVLAVSGTGMTPGEAYSIGALVVRPPAY